VTTTFPLLSQMMHVIAPIVKQNFSLVTIGIVAVSPLPWRSTC
jgi:hypothetical protein